MLEIYCDGSCLGNGKEKAQGGWAFCVIYNNKILFKQSGSEKNTTNNRMELLGLISAVKYINKYFPNTPITYFLDSAYIVNCFRQKWYVKWLNNGWLTSKKEPVKNKDLWEELFNILPEQNYTIEKVKGHSTNMFNNFVDLLAVKAAKEV